MIRPYEFPFRINDFDTVSQEVVETNNVSKEDKKAILTLIDCENVFRFNESLLEEIERDSSIINSLMCSNSINHDQVIDMMENKKTPEDENTKRYTDAFLRMKQNMESLEENEGVLNSEVFEDDSYLDSLQLNYVTVCKFVVNSKATKDFKSEKKGFLICMKGKGSFKNNDKYYRYNEGSVVPLYENDKLIISSDIKSNFYSLYM